MPEPLYFYTKSMPYWGLSNFAPPGIEMDGVFWQTVEHYYQAQKFANADVRDRIRRAASPKDARTLGQSRAFTVRADWDLVREEIMLMAVRAKFNTPSARAVLLSTESRWLVGSFVDAGPSGAGAEWRLVQVSGKRLQPHLYESLRTAIDQGIPTFHFAAQGFLLRLSRAYGEQKLLDAGVSGDTSLWRGVGYCNTSPTLPALRRGTQAIQPASPRAELPPAGRIL